MVWQNECVNSLLKPKRNMEDKRRSSTENYTEDSIRTKEGMKHIHLRPEMYIGALGDGTDPRHGINTILKEAIDNSVEEPTRRP